LGERWPKHIECHGVRAKERERVFAYRGVSAILHGGCKILRVSYLFMEY